MIQQNGQLPEANLPEVYKRDPYALDPESPLSLVEEEARNQGVQDQRSGTVRKHTHDGDNSEVLPFSGLSGLLKVMSSVPTGVPRNVFEQIVLYSNGGTRRLYVYVIDSVGTGAWRYTALT